MQNYIKELRTNVNEIMKVVEQYKYIPRVICYIDFVYLSNEDKVKTNLQCANSQIMQQLLVNEENDINQHKDAPNDTTENILPAFETACAYRNKTKVVIVIGDCCAHTHIGCECKELFNQYPKISGFDSEQERMAEINRMYQCQKCNQLFAEFDETLQNVEKVADHRRRWQNVCLELQKVPIIFVPVNQQINFKTKQVDEQYWYPFSGCSILKTHRMMRLMGCQQVITVNVNQGKYVRNLVKVIEKVMEELGGK